MHFCIHFLIYFLIWLSCKYNTCVLPVVSEGFKDFVYNSSHVDLSPDPHINHLSFTSLESFHPPIPSDPHSTPVSASFTPFPLFLSPLGAILSCRHILIVWKSVCLLVEAAGCVTQGKGLGARHLQNPPQTPALLHKTA